MFFQYYAQLQMTDFFHQFNTNLVEIRLPKKFSVCFFILISSQALSKVFWKFKI